MDESVVTRVMPNSIEAEQSVVGSMILDRQAIITAAEILRQDDFYYRQYGTMFQTMVDMNNEGKPVDIVTLQARLKETDVPAEVYSIEFVRELLSSVPTSANIRQYAAYFSALCLFELYFFHLFLYITNQIIICYFLI